MNDPENPPGSSSTPTFVHSKALEFNYLADKERELLEISLEFASKIIIVVGEAGVGKSDLLRQLKQQAETEAQLELLEKQSTLEKRLRKYKRSDPAETWSSRWVASQIAYLLPADRREEWLGDLYEVNREMLHKGFPRWQVNLNNVVRTAILVFSSLQIKLSDFISSAIGRRS
jgi:ABC-type cobalamin/Fe3+-siderophores transport system ATPase subunit